MRRPDAVTFSTLRLLDSSTRQGEGSDRELLLDRELEGGPAGDEGFQVRTARQKVGKVGPAHALDD